jgi:hypothetical protein
MPMISIKPGYLFFFLLLFSSILAKAGDTLVQASSLWKYIDDGNNPDSSWYQSTYNDSSWSSGLAQFGFGDGDEMTVINFGSDPHNKYITTYFRQSFNVVDSSIYKGIRLYIKRDDGAVVYLNGHKIYQSNIASDTVDYQTLADYEIEPGSEEYYVPVSLDSARLLTGNNVIAVEIHLSRDNSDDMSFDLYMIGDSEAEIMRGPYLQNATMQSMKVCYRTSIPEISKVYYGLITAYTDSVIDTSHAINHFVQLSGLLPGTKYYYSVHSSSKVLAGDSTFYFYSSPDSNSRTPVRIWAMADFGAGNMHQIATRDAYYIYSYNQYTDIVLWGGDNAYPWGNDEDYTANVFTNHYEDILKKSVVYSAIGNHDEFSANSVNENGTYFDIFDFPVNGEAGGIPSGKENYYSFNYSNIHFICLDSNIDSIDSTTLTTMINWLQLDLAANTKPWTIAYFHNPVYSKGYHDSDNGNEAIFMRTYVSPVLEQYNVDLVISGHSHDYERSYLLKGHYGLSTTFDSLTMAKSMLSGTPPDVYNKFTPNDSGTVYAVIGNTSEITPVQSDWPHPAMYCSIDSVYGSFIIEVNGDTLKGKMLTDSMVIADEFAIVKSISTAIPKITVGNSGYSLFPSPVTGQLNINSKSNFRVSEIIIYDGVGRSVKRLGKISNPSMIQVDVRNFTPGIYIALIRDENGSHTLKFIKE